MFFTKICFEKRKKKLSVADSFSIKTMILLLFVKDGFPAFLPSDRIKNHRSCNEE